MEVPVQVPSGNTAQVADLVAGQTFYLSSSWCMKTDGAGGGSNAVNIARAPN